ncbi:class I SAM-dependent methyltransferase [Chloroflexota bacterium]
MLNNLLLAPYFYLRKLKYSKRAKKQDWKQIVLDFWKWESDTKSEAVYSRICDGKKKENFYAYDSSIVWYINPRSTDVCLNIGCGIGRVENKLCSHVLEVHSVDISEGMIRIAKENFKNIPNVSFYINNGESLSMFQDDTFDFAFAELIFQHVPSNVVNAYVSEVYRVLKSGGRFICQIPTIKKYGHMPRQLCAWMTKKEVDELFSLFSSVNYDSGGTNEYYYCPIATK